MHEANVQRAVKQARLKLGISVLPQVMGHKSLETTMGYLHADSLRHPKLSRSVPKIRGADEKSTGAIPTSTGAI